MKNVIWNDVYVELTYTGNCILELEHVLSNRLLTEDEFHEFSNDLEELKVKRTELERVKINFERGVIERQIKD